MPTELFKGVPLSLEKPIGVAQWQTRIVKALPKEFKGILPTVEEIEAELGPSNPEKEKGA